MSRAAALLDVGDATAALHAPEMLPESDVVTWQPWWVTRSRVAEVPGDRSQARSTLERGIGLTEDPVVRVWLSKRLARL